MTAKEPNRLFNHNPPTQDELVGKLFYNREPELAQGLKRLAAPIDEGKICAIYGMPRAGKSHFARYLLLRAREARLPLLILALDANTRGSARGVIEEAFFKIMAQIRAVPEAEVPEGQTEVLREYLEHLDQYQDVVGRDSIEITIERSTSIARTNDLGAKLVRAPFEISAVDRIEERVGTGNKLVQRSLTDRELVEIVRYALDVLAWLHPSQRVLLFIDDLDLLDRHALGGQPEANLLVDHLRLLAEPPTLLSRPPTLVLATTRNTAFTDRDKDFQDFVEIRLLDPEQHLAIYQKHIELFNAGEQVFTERTVEWLEERCGGQVGMFLRRCRELWSYFDDRLPPGTLIDIEHVKTYVKKDVRDMLRDPESSAGMAEVQAAVRQGQMQLALSAQPAPGLLYRVLAPLGGAGQYRVNPIYFEVIRELIQPGAAG